MIVPEVTEPLLAVVAQMPLLEVHTRLFPSASMMPLTLRFELIVVVAPAIAKAAMVLVEYPSVDVARYRFPPWLESVQCLRFAAALESVRAINGLVPATSRFQFGVVVPIPTLPALVMVVRAVSAVRASLIVPNTREPFVEDAYQCLRSTPAPVSERTRFGDELAEIWSLPNGVEVPIPTLRFVVSRKKSFAPVIVFAPFQ